MMCTTVLHGGVCHRTLTPHKSGKKMKEKKKKICRTGTFTSASVGKPRNCIAFEKKFRRQTK